MSLSRHANFSRTTSHEALHPIAQNMGPDLCPNPCNRASRHPAGPFWVLVGFLPMAMRRPLGKNPFRTTVRHLYLILVALEHLRESSQSRIEARRVRCRCRSRLPGRLLRYGGSCAPKIGSCWQGMSVRGKGVRRRRRFRRVD